MAGLAAAFWFRWLTIGEESRPVIAGVMLLAAIGDAMIALRFLGERD